MPGLTCNLFSVPQFIDHSNSIVSFTRNMCVMQDHTLRVLIGAGEHRDGLYYFKGTPRTLALKIDKVASLDLWHQRLGHPSLQVIKLIPAVGFQKIMLTSICVAIYVSVQNRLEKSFLLVILELLNCLS